MKAIIIGIDPSYKNLATASLTEDKKIIFTCDGESLGNSVDFNRAHIVADKLTSRVMLKLKKRFSEVSNIISEIPPPNSSYSSGLFSLDSLLLYKSRVVLKPINILTVSASFLGHLHGTQDYSKKDSKTLALHFIERFEELGYEIVMMDKNLNNDMSEAFLFMLKGICALNILGLRDFLVGELGSLDGEYYKVLYSKEGDNT